MTAAELEAALAAVGWRGKTLARFMRCDETTVRHMREGKRHVPEPVARFLERLVAWHDKNPMPEWRTRPDLDPANRSKA